MLSKNGLKPKLRFAVLLVGGICLTLITGVVCGKISQRWGPAPDLVAAAQHLKTFPSKLGSWQLVEENSMSDEVVRTLNCAGYIFRQYLDRHSGNTVTLAVTLGPTGPISVHTPEICYSSRDYSPEGKRQAVSLTDAKGKSHSFWRNDFRANNAIGERLRVYYAWCADREWSAAESPRFDFAGKRLLHKIQIASIVPPGQTKPEQDSCRLFLQDLLNSGWQIDG